MAGDWQPVPLGSLAADHEGAIAIGPFGSAMKAELYTSNGVPVIRGTNIKSSRKLGGDWVFIPEDFADAMPRCVVREGDLVFPHRGAIGEVALVPGNRDRYFLSTSFMKITLDREKVDPRYAAYYFRSAVGRSEIMRFASQVGTPGIGQPLTSLRQFVIPAPPVSIQRAIADLLSALEDKIELSQEMAATLEETARALFNSWFVDFDAVRAKAEGRDPGLSVKTSALFPERFGADGLPEGWVKRPLLQFARLISGGTPKTDEPAYWNGLLSWASAKDVSQCPDRFLIGTERTITKRGLDESATRIVPAFSTVFVARGATTGRHCLLGREMAMNQTCYALDSIKETPFWLACAFTHLVDELVQSAHGSVFDTITTTTLGTANVIDGGQALMGAFEISVQPLYQRILGLIEEAAILRTLRDTLAPKLISGELRIKDAEKAVAA